MIGDRARIRRLERKVAIIMADLTGVTQAIADLNTKVDVAVAALQAGAHPSQAELDAAAQGIVAAGDKLTTALTPAPPAA
jgi:polysaccharide deacetylase 2 family uncharacterized protein YibQ